MVCHRCKMTVKAELEKAGLEPLCIDFGEVEIKENPAKFKLDRLDTSLKSLGFELIDDKKIQTIEKIKNAIHRLIYYQDGDIKTKLSIYISSQVNQDFNYLSNFFSEVEGVTIEKYFIAHKIERAKELLVYAELSLSEIAHQLGYDSVTSLSNQFKQVNGLTPSHYRALREHKRKNIA
jgi:AraC-like DNA-binding protein